MSRRGNCIDNAPIESFFGHSNDDVDSKEALNIIYLKILIDENMEHYITTRIHWDLKKMTPAIPKSSNHNLNLQGAPFY